jgi:hypothetical protein
MTERRQYHGCSRIVRNGHDQMVVFGGFSYLTGKYSSTIEFYDLTLLPTSWEIASGITLPTAMGRIKGSVVMKLDDNLCDVMLISNTTGRMHQCSGNYEWTEYNISSNLTRGWKKMAVIDANLF